MKNKFSIFGLILLCILMTGCWNSQELNELAIATALGIDESEDGYLITVQLINPGVISKQSASNGTPITTYRTTGKTVFEALRRLTLENPRRIYMAHLRLIVISESLAKEKGIAKIMDFFSRDHEIRPDFYIMIARDTKAELVLNILTPLESIPASKLYSALKTSEEVWAPTHHVLLAELQNRLLTDGIEPVLTGTFIKGDPETGMNISNIENTDVPTTVQIGSIAAFKEDKLIGWLTEVESKGFNYINGTVGSTIVSIPWFDEGDISIELLKSKEKVDVLSVNGIPKIRITIDVEGNIGEVHSDVDLFDIKIIDKMENLLESEINSNIESAVNKAQNLNSDIFGFGRAIHRTYPSLWNKLKDDWDSNFKNLDIEIDINAKIEQLGTNKESLER